MKLEGNRLLKSEDIPEGLVEHYHSFDLRYVKQYHEVNIEVNMREIEQADLTTIADRFHQKHNKLFGYSLVDEETPIELINLRLMCVGRTIKPNFQTEDYGDIDASKAYKNSRKIFLPLQKCFKDTDVFDGALLKFGNKVTGPAIIEQLNTTTFVSPEYNLIVDKFGSYILFLKSKEKEIEKILKPF